MKKFIVIFLLLICLFPTFSKGRSESLDNSLPEKTSKVLKFAMNPPEKGGIVLDPYNTTESNSVIILQNLYEGLFSYDPKTGEPEKAIAKSWEVSTDGLVWTFKLNNKAKFSDGTKITAKDIVKSWENLLNSRLAFCLDFLKGVSDDSSKIGLKTNGDDTLIIELEYPEPDLPSILCQPCLSVIKNSSVFSGPYVVEYFDDSLISLRPNSYYRNKIANDGVDILFSDDVSKEFLNGNIQWSMSYIEKGEEYLISYPLYATSFFYFSSKQGAFTDERVRQALYGVVPWEAVRLISNPKDPRYTLIPDSDAQIPVLKSPEELYREYGEKLPPIHIGIHRGAQVAAVAEMIADIWSRSFGITVSLDTVPLTVYSENPKESPYDFACITWIGDYYSPLSFLNLFESNSSYNLANYSDKEFDQLMDKARKDEENRDKYILMAEQRLLDSCVVIPISGTTSTNFVNSELIDGWYPNFMDIHPFKTIKFK